MYPSNFRRSTSKVDCTFIPLSWLLASRKTSHTFVRTFPSLPNFLSWTRKREVSLGFLKRRYEKEKTSIEAITVSSLLSFPLPRSEIKKLVACSLLNSKCLLFLFLPLFYFLLLHSRKASRLCLHFIYYLSFVVRFLVHRNVVFRMLPPRAVFPCEWAKYRSTFLSEKKSTKKVFWWEEIKESANNGRLYHPIARYRRWSCQFRQHFFI